MAEEDMLKLCNFNGIEGRDESKEKQDLVKRGRGGDGGGGEEVVKTVHGEEKSMNVGSEINCLGVFNDFNYQKGSYNE